MTVKASYSDSDNKTLWSLHNKQLKATWVSLKGAPSGAMSKQLADFGDVSMQLINSN